LSREFLRIGGGAHLVEHVKVIHGDALMFDGLPTLDRLKFALVSWKHSDSSDDVYKIIVEMIEKAMLQQVDAQRLNNCCIQLRKQVESLIGAAK